MEQNEKNFKEPIRIALNKNKNVIDIYQLEKLNGENAQISCTKINNIIT